MSEDNKYENGCDSDGKIGPFLEAVMDEDAMNASYIEPADNFNAEASAASLPEELAPTITTTEKRSTETSTPPLLAEPTPTLTTTEIRGDVLCASLDKCEMLDHRAFSTHKCPYCQLNIHGMCGVQNPKGDSSVTYSYICFRCCKKQILHRLKLTFKIV